MALQAVPVWLPLTATYLYNQVRHLPPKIASPVVCETTDHLDQFATPALHALSGEPRWRQIWDRGLRKIGFRHHLSYHVRVGRAVRAQLLHSHWGNVGWANMGAARALAVPHVVTFYGKDVNFLPVTQPVWRERYHDLFTQVAAVVCEGPFMGERLIDLGCPREKVRVLHLGVSLDRIRFEPRRWTPGTPLRILMAASFREKKGFPLALEAIGRLRAATPIEVTIIGDSSADDPRSVTEKTRILDVIARHGMGDSVRLLGYRPHQVVFDEAARSHIFLSPSITAADGDTEGGAPVTIIEMAASGIPVVASTHCDIPEVIVHGEGGRLAREGDLESLVDELQSMVAHPETWAAMASAARAHLEREFDVRVQAERLADIYRSVVAARAN